MRNWGAQQRCAQGPRRACGAEAGPGCGGRGRRGAWPGTKTTHRGTRQHTRPHWYEGRRGDRGARLRCPRAAAEANRQHTNDKPRPIGGRREACGAWPGFEPTRRAKLAARTASGRAGPTAAAGDLSGPQAPATQPPGYAKGAGTEVPAPCRLTQPLPRRGLRPNDRQSWRRRRIHRNMPPTTAAPRPAPPIRPSKPVRARRWARPVLGVVAGTSGAT